MLNTQIPSGLQALMQAAQILQQQASPSAPGPQGQQPTVAKQVEQAAAQQAMPDMQAVGQQAGIAGQMMAQRQQQQQQMAQNPQAVAQMAAQMLRQGVGSLPSNMQFKEGGIIGYAGPEGSDVRVQPIPDRELAEMEDEDARERRRRSMFRELEPELLPVIERGEPREPRRPPPVDAAGQRMDTALGRAYRREIAQAPQERPAGLAQIVEEQRPIPSAIQRLRETVPPALQRLREAGSFERYAEGARGPKQDLAAVLESEFQRGAEAGAEPRPAPGAPPKQEAPAAEARPETSPAPSGIAAVAPRTRQTYAEILAGTPEDIEARGDLAAKEAINRRMLAARAAQADLAGEGIAALGRSEAERRRLLEQQRSRDSFNSFMALAKSLQTRGDEYMAYKAGMQARDESDRLAKLSNEEAVLKLKQAQQARQMGDLELEKKFLDEYAAGRRQIQQDRMAQAKAVAEYESRLVPAEIQAQTAFLNRQQELKLKIDELKAKAAERRDLKLRDQMSINGQRVSKAYADLEKSIKENFPTYGLVKNTAPDKLSANDRTIISQVNAMRDRVEKQIIAPLEALINEAAKELDIKMPEVPQVSGVDWSSLPKK